ncbi:MAG TPA: phosphohistidine phosphatase SixA [Nitrospirota bacterium]|nr:phosphohistidine phosphatase SixA [Nitrospirota bacterium]
MFLYLAQHGEAKREEEDPARGLTDKGVQDVRKVAAYAQKMNLRIGRIFHSDKARAMQTAQIFADYLKPGKGGPETASLAPMDDPAIWAKRIAEVQEDTMLVGHLPHMVKLAGLLLCGDKENMFIDFKMGGVVCLTRFDDGRWALEWMLVPEIMH